jgi:Tol biopolymer transport system component
MSLRETRLDSWKEIAHYLGRNERTVQRWELERGLPIHRLPGTKRGGVFAFSEELDIWLAKTAGLEEREADELEYLTGDEAVTTASPDETVPGENELPPLPVVSAAEPRVRRRWQIVAYSGLAVLVLAAIAFISYALNPFRTNSLLVNRNSLVIQQLNFRRGLIRAARFRPDGQNLVYWALWEDSPASQLYETSLGQPESSPLRAPEMQLLSVSRSSTLAVLMNPEFAGPYLQLGTLAVQGLYEDKPVKIAPNVGWADWGVDGSTLYYTVTDQNGLSKIEAYSMDSRQVRLIYPENGTPEQLIDYIRVSPTGKLLAFEQKRSLDNGGEVVILPLSGGTRVVSRYFGNLAGLAWSPSGKEVWFTAAEKGLMRSICSLRIDGSERVVYQAPDALTIQDISANGDVLVTRDFLSSDVYAKRIDEPSGVTDLSLFDWSMLGDLSGDGKKVAILENGNATRKPSVYLRSTSGGPATNLGDAAFPISFSPDGNSLLALSNDKCAHVVLLSQDRQTQVLTRSSLCASRAVWVPDGRRMVFDAVETGYKPRCYIQTIGAADARPFTSEGMHCPLVSPDGRFALAQNESELYKIAIDGSQPPKKINAASADAGRIRPVRWLADDKVVIMGGRGVDLAMMDLTTGTLSAVPFKVPAQPNNIVAVKVSSDLKSVAYSAYGMRSDLILIRGLR